MVQSMKLVLALIIWKLVVGKYIPSYQTQHYHGNTHASSDLTRDKTMRKKRYNIFKSNLEIMHYLKMFGTDMMIWRCKNAVQPVWHWRPIPVLELKCETLGILKEVAWYHNGKKLDVESEHYSETIKPHMSRGKFFSAWLDFNLKIYNATLQDAGVYSFKAVSRKGFSSEHSIYVDISKQKKHKKNPKKSTKSNRRKHKKKSMKKGRKSKKDYDRFYLFHKYHSKHGGHTQVKEIKTGKNTYYTI